MFADTPHSSLCTIYGILSVCTIIMIWSQVLILFERYDGTYGCSKLILFGKVLYIPLWMNVDRHLVHVYNLFHHTPFNNLIVDQY